MNQHFRSALLAFATSFVFISLALAKAGRAQTKKNTTQGEIEAYFHFETPNGQTTIYNKAGYDYNSCKKDSSCEARAWVTGDNSKIVDYNTPPKRIFLTDENGLVINPNTNEPMFNEYIEVTIEYTPSDKSKKILEKKKITGWVDADYIRYRNKNEEKERPYYDDHVVDIKLPKQKDKPLPKRWESCEKPADFEIPHLNEIAESTSKAQQPLLLNKKVVQEAEVLTEELNICIQKSPKELLDYPDNGELTYDKYVLPKVKNKKVPNFEKEIVVGKDKKGNDLIEKVPMTQKDLIAIDAVARTLYGEAARCFKKGPQHAAAIAAVINNRTQFPKSDFVQGNHSSDKEINAKLATSPRQFHVWHPTYIKEEKDHSKKL